MSHSELHPHLRGSALESRMPVNVQVEDEPTAKAQERLLRTHFEESGIVNVGVGCSALAGQWTVHVWRGAWSPWPAPTGPPRTGFLSQADAPQA
jgi:hypothetical protein